MSVPYSVKSFSFKARSVVLCFASSGSRFQTRFGLGVQFRHLAIWASCRHWNGRSIPGFVLYVYGSFREKAMESVQTAAKDCIPEGFSMRATA